MTAPSNVPTFTLGVPVTAKLSRKFYERLGDDIATELVDWFNAVDEIYRNQLKEMNELNWQRFNDCLDAGLANLRADLIKWMFVFWIGNAMTTAGLVLGILFRGSGTRDARIPIE